MTFEQHLVDKNNPHEVTKGQVGLSNVDNTRDMEKPLSAPQQAAINTLKENVLEKSNEAAYNPTQPYHPATKEYVDILALRAGLVVSVFGRGGAVTAQSGDYTAEMVGAAPLSHVEDEEVHLTQEKKTQWDNKASTATHMVTLTAEGWEGTTAPYTQTISVTGVMETDNPFADIVSPTVPVLDAWSKVSQIITGNGTMTAVCLEQKPGVEITLQVKVIR